MSTKGKRFLCKIGFHVTYQDNALFTRVERCAEPNCDWVSSEADAADLDTERKAWRQASNEGVKGFGPQTLRVMEILGLDA